MTQNLSKPTKRLFKTAGIFSFIFFAIYLIFTLGVLFEISMLEDLVKSAYEMVYVNITEAELESTMFTFIIDSGFACVINFFAGKSYINLSKSNKFYVEGERTIIFLIGVQFLFGLCILPCIFAIIADCLYYKGLKKVKEVNRKVFDEFNTNQSNSSENANKSNETESSLENNTVSISNEELNITTLRILELKQRLSENQITQEEYDKEFNEILSQKISD